MLINENGLGLAVGKAKQVLKSKQVSSGLYCQASLISSIMSPNKESSGHPNNPTQNSKIQEIVDMIPALLDRLPKDKSSTPPPTRDNHQNNSTQTNGDNSNGSRGEDKENEADKNYNISNDQSNITGNKNDKQFLKSNRSELLQIRDDLIYMQNALSKLKKFEDDFSPSIKELKRILDRISSAPDEEIRKLRKKCLNLKSKIPLAHGTSSADLYGQLHQRKRGSKDIPSLCVKEILTENYFFKELRQTFDRLVIRSKLCLLCFAVFPENAVIKKSMLIHWWIGERLLEQLTQDDKNKKKTAEDIANEILRDFEAKKFIYAVEKRYRKVPTSYKMYPIVRSAVIKLATEAMFFDYDSEGIPTLNFQNCSRACLVFAEEGSNQERIMEAANGSNQVRVTSQDKGSKQDKVPPQGEVPKDDKDSKRDEGSKEDTVSKQEDGPKQEVIRTLFNVSEEFPDFKYDWFSKMKNIRVLCLGRWQSSDDEIQSHIEVESTKYLEGLKNMRQLKFLSLQGVTGIQDLPSSISSLTDLRILDLRACYNLEKLPKEIQSLKKLTHLDISECSLLDGMPGELCSLSELEVFKGFVISDPKKGIRHQCALKNLVKLKKLRKLSISINSGAFDVEELSIISRFENLVELKVEWGGESSQTKQIKNTGGEAKSTAKNSDKKLGDKKVESGPKKKYLRSLALRKPRLYESLRKLDLLCFPDESLPRWLNPADLVHLKKLYIRGGRLKTLRLQKEDTPHQYQEVDSKWPLVEVLRLKFLNELKSDWKELQELFPKLNYLEKFKCPKVTLCPCDGTGVWEKP